jgi:hypothetical protein
VLACVLGACNRDEKSLFEKSAAERAVAALTNAQNVFVSPKYGWEMLYFPNPESSGENILLSFDANGKVEATTKSAAATNNKMVTDSCTWEVMNDYGPILTFNTYNKVLHAWADPRQDGDGLLGDYEFLILQAESDYVKLKGKKHSAYSFMYPMKSAMSATDYYAEKDAMNNKLFANANLLHVKLGSGEYLLNGGQIGIFMLTSLGEVPNLEELEIYPVAVTLDGIQLMVPIREQGETKYDLKNGVLSNSSAKIFAATANEHFIEHIKISHVDIANNEYVLRKGAWAIDINDINDDVKAKIATVNADLKKAYKSNKKASIQGMKIKPAEEGYELLFSYLGNSSKTATEMNYTFNVSSNGSTISLEYVGPADDNAQKVIDAFPNLVLLFESLNGTYSLSAKEAINPTLGIKMTENSNSEKWFNLTGTIE